MSTIYRQSPYSFLILGAYLMRILSFLRQKRNRIAELESYVKTLEKTLAETAPKGPYLYIAKDDGYTYVYQCVGKSLTPHWTENMYIH